MRFSLLITLLIFSLLGCQTMSTAARNSTKSTNSSAKKSNPTVSSKLATNQPKVKQTAANPALTQQNLYEELTGKKGASAKTAPARILELARDAKWKRDYVTALKRYNTLIVKFPKAKKEVRQAYLDKADLYKEMGLLQQSKYNLEKAKK